MPGQVLIVEDPLVRRLIGGILRRAGFNVIEAGILRAIEMLDGGSEDVALLVTNAPEHFLKWSQTLALVYVAASPDPWKAEKFRRCRMLHKPFHPEALADAANAVLEAASK
jgi:CheY-like chemotaxis protein